jgi:hypothetical protein
LCDLLVEVTARHPLHHLFLPPAQCLKPSLQIGTARGLDPLLTVCFHGNIHCSNNIVLAGIYGHETQGAFSVAHRGASLMGDHDDGETYQ